MLNLSVPHKQAACDLFWVPTCNSSNTAFCNSCRSLFFFFLRSTCDGGGSILMHLYVRTEASGYADNWKLTLINPAFCLYHLGNDQPDRYSVFMDLPAPLTELHHIYSVSNLQPPPLVDTLRLQRWIFLHFKILLCQNKSIQVSPNIHVHASTHILTKIFPVVFWY